MFNICDEWVNGKVFCFLLMFWSTSVCVWGPHQGDVSLVQCYTKQWNLHNLCAHTFIHNMSYSAHEAWRGSFIILLLLHGPCRFYNMTYLLRPLMSHGEWKARTLAFFTASRHRSLVCQWGFSFSGSRMCTVFEKCSSVITLLSYVRNKWFPSSCRSRRNLLDASAVNPTDPLRPFTSWALGGRAVPDEWDRSLAFKTLITWAVAAMHRRVGWGGVGVSKQRTAVVVRRGFFVSL